jgi:hypothetical protein
VQAVQAYPFLPQRLSLYKKHPTPLQGTQVRQPRFSALAPTSDSFGARRVAPVYTADELGRL